MEVQAKKFNQKILESVIFELHILHFWLPYIEFNKRTLDFGLLQPIFHASVHTREQDT